MSGGPPFIGAGRYGDERLSPIRRRDGLVSGLNEQKWSEQYGAEICTKLLFRLSWVVGRRGPLATRAERQH